MTETNRRYMMKTTETPNKIWSEYNKAVAYNRSIDLYDTVRKNENFFIGRQWEGVHAPDLAKPVINVLRRVVNYFISMIVADDVGIAFTPFIGSEKMRRRAEVWSAEVERVIELSGIKDKTRDVIRNAAVDGDGALYFYFDKDCETGSTARGRIECEVVDNTNLLFGNPYVSDVQKQNFVIVETRKSVDTVRAEAIANGMDEREASEIAPDSEYEMYDVSRSRNGDELVTVLVKFWRENGEVCAIKTTRDKVIRPAWNTGYHRYPIAVMPWEKVKNSYHGVAAITGLIPNQISINQLFAMAIHSVKSNAFPKTIYDATKISGWSNKVGQAIGVVGNPNDAIASAFRGADMSGQVLQLIDKIIQNTLEFMGASDAALGNINPQNTSAIIATQKASAMPLELQRLSYRRFTEDYVRILVDMMSVDYGLREVATAEDEAGELFDFTAETCADLSMKVDIGSAAYWSELMQVQTMDNLFAKGVISDVVTYLEGIPEQYLRNKGKILAKLKNEREQAEMKASSPAVPDMGQTAPPVAPPMQSAAPALPMM